MSNTTKLGVGGLRLPSRATLLVISLVVFGVAAYLNWGWLAAAGVAPILLALAPCAAMCALGMCMKKSDGKSCSAGSAEKKGEST